MNTPTNKKKNFWVPLFLFGTLAAFLTQPFLFSHCAKASPGSEKSKGEKQTTKSTSNQIYTLKIQTQHSASASASASASGSDSDSDSDSGSKLSTQNGFENQLLFEFIEKNEKHAENFNWHVLWPYLKNTIHPITFLEVTRHGGKTTLYSFINVLSNTKPKTKWQFNSKIESLFYIFSALKSWRNDHLSDTNPMIHHNVKIAKQMLAFLRKSGATLYFKQISTQEKLIKQTDYEAIKSSVIRLSHELHSLFPDILTDDGIRKARLTNAFTDYQYIYQLLELPYPEPSVFTNNEGSYIDFVEKLPHSKQQHGSKINHLSFTLSQYLPEISNDTLKQDCDVIDAFSTYFTQKWNNAKKSPSLRKKMAILALENFLINPLSPESSNDKDDDSTASSFSNTASDEDKNEDDLTESLQPNVDQFSYNDSEIMQVILEYADKYEIIGQLLGISETEQRELINYLKRTEQFSNSAAMTSMLRHWMNQDMDQATLSNLIAIFSNHTGFETLAQDISILHNRRLGTALPEETKMFTSIEKKWSTKEMIINFDNVHVIYHVLFPYCDKWAELARNLGLSEDDIAKIKQSKSTINHESDDSDNDDEDSTISYNSLDDEAKNQSRLARVLEHTMDSEKYKSQTDYIKACKKSGINDPKLIESLSKAFHNTVKPYSISWQD